MALLQRSESGRLKAKRLGGIKPTERKGKEWGYLIIWEFQVRQRMEKRFKKAYGAKGEWAGFFRQDELYIGTELVHETKAVRTYVTLDVWTSKEAYDRFREQHLSEYEAIDKKCEDLTESEREIGSFLRVSNE
jgi:hypothetical protein